MTKKIRLNWALALAVGLGWAGTASAQYQLQGNNGRLNEANNRIGSNGSNDSIPPPKLPNGNQIITGNVTGGRQFQGVVPYTDLNSLHVPTAGAISDNFIRSSSGAPFGGINQNNANSVQPFYGRATTATPPAGFTPQGPGGGYVPATPIMTRQAGDLRLGQVVNNPTVSNILPKPGQLILPGPVDPSSQTSSIISASPLYGVRQFNPLTNAQDQAALNSTMGTGSLTGVRMDPAIVAQLRGQLLQSQQTPLQQTDSDNQNLNPNKSQIQNGALQPAFESPQNTPLNSSVGLQGSTNGTSGSANNSLSSSGNLSTGESTRQRLLNSPRIQSAQFGELQKRLAQNKSVQDKNDLTAARKYNQDLRHQESAAARAKPGIPNMPGPGTPGGLPGTPAESLPPAVVGIPQGVGPIPMPGAPANVPPTPPPSGNELTGTVDLNPPGTIGARPAPLKIKSLAEGVQAKALADMLKDAEDLTRNGKYNSALEQYDMADQVAPNNAVVQLGRANVELGRTYYARAEQNIRQAFTQDQALLMGQYDLQALLGQDRLETIVRDLKQVSEREQKEPRPVFLLAYIAYNTGNERRAAAYLDLAEKRAGGKDPLYALIRKHWALPQDTAPINPEDLNK